MGSRSSPQADESDRLRRPQADETWDDHYRDERDAAYLYRALADVEKAPELRQLFEKLAVVEDGHTQRWEELFRASGRPLPSVLDGPAHTAAGVGRPAFRHVPRVADDAGGGGPRGEAYSGWRAARPAGRARNGDGDRGRVGGARPGTVRSDGSGGRALACHATGGYLRSVVYGFNDGLTANFGLVPGARRPVAPHIVIITGVAGALADALSMGSSGYLAAKSEAEVARHQIGMEREEMRLMPDLEEESWR